LGLVSKKTDHPFSCTVPNSLSSFWDYIKPKEKQDAAKKKAEEDYWANKEHEESLVPAKPYSEPTFGTEEWHRTSKRRCDIHNHDAKSNPKPDTNYEHKGCVAYRFLCMAR